MKQSILITKYIIDLLEANTGLTTLVGTNIYPIDAKQGTTFPFIVVKRTNIDTQYSKDGRVSDTVGFSVIVVAESYIDSVTIAQLVRQTLELYRGVVDATNDVSIKYITFTGINEDLYNNAFIQQLNFNAIM